MYIKEKIESHKEQFRQLCMKYGVSSLYGFGSAVRDDFILGKSDIDLYVEINNEDPIKKGNALMGFWSELQEFFKTRVDLITANSVKNPYLKNSIETTKILLYDGKSQEMAI